MALELDFTITQSCNCLSIQMIEKTGAYDLNDNATGWGAPNAEISQVTSSTLSITFPAGGTPDSVSVTPNNQTTVELDLDADDIDSITEGASFPSGLYQFEYEVVADGTTYTKTKQYYFWCTLQCCVDKLFAGIDFDDCGCEDPQIEEALTAKAYLDGLAYHAAVGNYTEADNIKTKLENICTNSKYCNDCG